MSEKRKYPSTELSTAQRELIARLVGPLEARGISRSVFRDILADAEITVPKSSLDRWVHAHAVTGELFTAEKASGAVPLLDDAQCEIFAGLEMTGNPEETGAQVPDNVHGGVQRAVENRIWLNFSRNAGIANCVCC